MQIEKQYCLSKASDLPYEFQQKMNPFYDNRLDHIMVAHSIDLLEVACFISFTDAMFPHFDSLVLHQHVLNHGFQRFKTTTQSIDLLQFIRSCHMKKRLISRHDSTSFPSLLMLKKLGFQVVQRLAINPAIIILDLSPQKHLTNYKKRFDNSSISLQNLSNSACFHLSKWLGIEIEEVSKQSWAILERNGCLHWDISSSTISCLWEKKGSDEAFFFLGAQSNYNLEYLKRVLLERKFSNLFTTNIDDQVRDFLFFCNYIKEGQVPFLNKNDLSVYRYQQ